MRFFALLLLAVFVAGPAYAASLTAAYEDGKTAFIDAGKAPTGTALIVFERADKAKGPWEKRGELPYHGTRSYRDSSFSQFLDKNLTEGETYYYRASFLATDGAVLLVTPVVAFENKEP